jgi:transcriptional regulator with XRE-family HTH domain
VTGREVKRLRRALGLKQTELADKLGVHPITVSRWERDIVRMPEPTARLLTLLAQIDRKTKRK